MPPVGSAKAAIKSTEPAIPDSEADQKLVHRYSFGRRTPFIDLVGTADATNNGTTEVVGDWVGDAAREGDGTSAFVETTTLGGFGSDMSNGFAIAFSFLGSEGLSSGGSASIFGTFNDGTDSTGIQYPDPSSADRELFIRDDNGNDSRVSWPDSETFEDNNPHRIVLNYPDPNNASGWEVYADQTAQSLNVVTDNTTGPYADFQYAVTLFARNVRGSVDSFVNCILDDVCIFGDPLTSTEAQSYTNPWQ